MEGISYNEMVNKVIKDIKFKIKSEPAFKEEIRELLGLNDFTELKEAEAINVTNEKMVYEKDSMEDGTIYERYEGAPNEIRKLLISRLEEDKGAFIREKYEDQLKELEEELVYDQEDAMDFIRLRLKKDHEAEITEGLLRAILELEEDYMRSVGIIED